MTSDPERAQGSPAALAKPQIALAGDVDDDMLRAFIDALQAAADDEGPVALELTTPGGDADVARRMVADLRLFREQTGRRLLFCGKGMVYSAGVTVMSAFPPADRWLARETTLLIHGRSLTKTIDLEGPLETSRIRVLSLLAEIDQGLRLERDDLARLAAGTDLALDLLVERARIGWFVGADEALASGLIGGLI